MHADKVLEEFEQQQPQAITHIRRASNEAESTNHSYMSSDALCTALPYAELEGPIPYDGPGSVLSSTVGSGYSPSKGRRYDAWVAAWKAINCHEPSSWKTPSPSPPESTTPLQELDVRYSFRVQQNLINPMFILRSCLPQSGRGPTTIPIRSQTPSPHPSDSSFEAPSPQPFYIMNTVPTTTTDPLAVPIPCTESISPIPV
jgi:hypothetical protein